jgi:lipopolysaccharide transport system ATP-binding protein
MVSNPQIRDSLQFLTRSVFSPNSENPTGALADRTESELTELVKTLSKTNDSMQPKSFRFIARQAAPTIRRLKALTYANHQSDQRQIEPELKALNKLSDTLNELSQESKRKRSTSQQLQPFSLLKFSPYEPKPVKIAANSEEVSRVKRLEHYHNEIRQRELNKVLIDDDGVSLEGNLVLPMSESVDLFKSPRFKHFKKSPPKEKIHETDLLPEGTILAARELGVCYRKPKKLFRAKEEAQEHWPITGVNFELLRGETLGVLGRNGAGKSTLLRVLAGVMEPDRGHLLKRPNISIQLLSVNLGFEKLLTGRENAIMCGMLLGKTKQFMLERLDAIAEYSELEAFFDEPIYSYSSGMRARLGFSIAVEADPDILLLDEVLAVGDAEFKRKSREKTHSLIESGKSVIIVSHNNDQLRKLGAKIITL